MVNLKINLTYSVFNRAKARNLTCIIKGETRFGFLLGYLSLSLSLWYRSVSGSMMNVDDQVGW